MSKNRGWHAPRDELNQIQASRPPPINRSTASSGLFGLIQSVAQWTGVQIYCISLLRGRCACPDRAIACSSNEFAADCRCSGDYSGAHFSVDAASHYTDVLLDWICNHSTRVLRGSAVAPASHQALLEAVHDGPAMSRCTHFVSATNFCRNLAAVMAPPQRGPTFLQSATELFRSGSKC